MIWPRNLVFNFYFILTVVPFLQESSSLNCFWLNCVLPVDRGHRKYMTCRPILFELLALIMFGEQYHLWSSTLYSFLICAPKFQYIHNTFLHKTVQYVCVCSFVTAVIQFCNIFNQLNLHYIIYSYIIQYCEFGMAALSWGLLLWLLP
jgi:hypothetical protein